MFFRSNSRAAGLAKTKSSLRRQRLQQPLLGTRRSSSSSAPAAAAAAARPLALSSYNNKITIGSGRHGISRPFASSSPPPPPPGESGSGGMSTESFVREMAERGGANGASGQAAAEADSGFWTSVAQRLSPATRERVLREIQAARSATTATSTSDVATPNAAATAAAAAAEPVPEPPLSDLKVIALTTAIPFVGFGFMDNAILIVAGDAIDTSLGVVLGISTMCAAALGNIISDVAGILLGTAIEDFCAKNLKLPIPDLTAAQRRLRSVRFANQIGCAIGIVVGCVIGMFPLMYIDSNKIQRKKREAHLDSIFRDVITEAGSLMGAQNITMFLLVHGPSADGEEERQSPVPTPDGKYLYAKYEADLAPSSSSSPSSKTRYLQSDRYIPLGRGIVSRAALTGTSWNIYDVRSEPDFSPESGSEDDDATSSVRNMVCVPVLDAQGRAIAVLQAINKVSKGITDRRRGDNNGGYDDGNASSKSETATARRGFTTNDVQMLKALASHISVSLQRMYETEEGADLRLKDTITILKDYGLEGLSSDQSIGGRKLLFPED